MSSSRSARTSTEITSSQVNSFDLVADVCHTDTQSIRLKVILETGVLADPDTIKAAATVAVANGADFLKTSTGKLEPAATPEAAAALLEVIAAAQRTVKTSG